MVRAGGDPDKFKVASVHFSAASAEWKFDWVLTPHSDSPEDIKRAADLSFLPRRGHNNGLWNAKCSRARLLHQSGLCPELEVQPLRLDRRYTSN